jgi:predicted negative regulator of RcsB-dependent stress response
MSNLPPNQTPAIKKVPDTADAKTEVEPPFDEQLRSFWENNRNAIYLGCILVVLAIIGRYAYDALVVQREAGIESAFAAATTPAKLRSFIGEYGRHPLVGAAWLKLADGAYATGNYSEALGSYGEAAAALPGTPFAARALLGKAMCQVHTGKTSEGTGALRQLAEDSAQLQTVRCEAACHLASLAFDAGRFDEVVKLTDLVMQIDTGSAWAQRALLMRARTPVPTAAAAPPAGQKDENAPAVSLKLPGS